MSGHRFTIDVDEVTLAAATLESLAYLTAAANQGFFVKEIRIMFKGVTVSNEPVTVEEYIATGTATGTSGTVAKRDPDAPETTQTSFQHTITAEPTGKTVLSRWYIHPQSGIVQPLPLTEPIHVKGGDKWGIQVTADDAVNAMIHLECEE